MGVSKRQTVNVIEGLQKLMDLKSGDPKGTRQKERTLVQAPAKGANPALGLTLLLALVVAVSDRGRRRTRATVRRRTPQSRLRYVGLSLLIGALERGITRKGVIAALKVARKCV